MITRGGFLATLAGLVLGPKVLGPFAIAGPSPEVWKAAPSLPLHPRTNEFVTLQQIVAMTVEIVAQETKWLHLEHVYEDWPGVRQGHTVRVRERPVFVPMDLGPPSQHFIRERMRSVPIMQHADAELRFERDEIRGRTLPEFSKRHVEPAAYSLAEEVIRSIRANGGGEYMVTIDQTVDVFGVPKAAQVLGVAQQISVRGIHMPPMTCDDPHREQVVHLDMLFGVG